MDKPKHDLRDDAGRPGVDGNTDAILAGHTDKVMPTVPSGENEVNPLPGSTAGVAEGQVTKSN